MFSKPKFVLYFAIIAAFFLFGYSAITQFSSAKIAKKDMKIEDDPQLIRNTLPNGFQYTLFQNKNPKHRITIALDVQVGSAFEKDNEQGLAHFLEHMAFRESKHFQNGKLVEEMQHLGIMYGKDLNASTSFLNTCYTVNLPDFNPHTLQTVFAFLGDVANGLSLTEKDVNQERGVILSEKRDYNGVQQRLYEASLKNIFDGTVFTSRLPIGQTNIIEAATATDLRNFYKKWYIPSNMTLVVVGNFETQQMQRWIENTFSNIPATSILPTPDFGEIDKKPLKFLYFADKDLPNSSIQIFSLFEKKTGEDNYLSRKKSAILKILSDVLCERLVEKRIETKSLFSASDDILWENALQTEFSLFGAELTSSQEQWPECLQLLEQEIRRLRLYGISEDELARQKKIMINFAKHRLESAKTLESNDILNELVTYQRNRKAYLSPTDNLRLIEGLFEDITTQECTKTLSKIWDHIHVHVTAKDKIENPEQTLQKILDQSMATLVPAPEKGSDLFFKYTLPNNLTNTSVITTHVSDMDITQLKLSNNVRVNLKPTTFSKQKVFMNLSIGNGLLTKNPLPKPGIMCIAENTFLQGGLGKNNWQQLLKILKSKSPLSFQFACQASSFDFKIFSDKKHAKFCLELLTAYLQDAAYDENAIYQAREDLKTFYRDAHASSGNVYKQEFQQFITSNKEFIGIPSASETLVLTMQDVKEFLEPILKNEYIELTVVGDFDVKEMTQFVQNTLGSIPQHQNEKNIKNESGFLSFPKDVKSHKLFYTGEEEQSLLILSFPTADFWEKDEDRKLRLLARIIRDRILEKVREEDGETYSPSVDNIASFFKDFGRFEILLSVSPSSTKKIQSNIQNIIEEVKGNISEEQLSRAKNPILSTLRDLLETNNYWLDNLSRCQSEPQILDFIRTIRPFLENVSAKDLQETAQKYLTDATVVTISKQPKILQHHDSE